MEEKEVIKKEINSIKDEDVGKKICIEGKVVREAPIEKPRIISLSDSTGTIDVISFKGALDKAKIDDYIKVEGIVKKKDGKVEINAISAEGLSDEKRRKIEKGIEDARRKERRIKSTDFLIRSEKLEAMRTDLERCASEIKGAIYDGSPVLIRHHGDCDGYSAAMALERAILPLIEKRHKSKGAVLKYYRRAPSRTPYYDYSDATRDITSINNNKDFVGDSETLLIIVDMGSSEENILSLKKAKLYDCKIVIIDHHASTKEESESIKGIADVYINPHEYGFGSELCAGMLATEIAKLINNKVEKVEMLPALAGIGDRSDCDEMTKYIEIAKREGYSEEYLRKLASVIDFETYHMRYIESREMTADLLGEDREKQDKIVEMIYDEIERNIEEITDSVVHYLERIERNGRKIGIVDILEVSERGYPGAGLIVGRVLSKMEKDGYLCILGKTKDSVIFRISEKSNVKIGALIEILQKKFPFAMISGGGHDKAGTIRFLPIEQENIINAIVEEFLEDES